MFIEGHPRLQLKGRGPALSPVAKQGSEGPWFNSNLGPSLSLPSTSPSLPFHSLPLLFPAQPLPLQAKRPPNPARGSWGSL